MHRTKPSLPFGALALLGVLAAVPAAQATTYVMMSDEELVDQNQLVVHGVVLARHYPLDGTTVYSVEVLGSLKGVASGVIEVQLRGGPLADGSGLHLPGNPAFAVGERALFFLVPVGSSRWTIPHLALGVFFEHRLAGHLLARRDLNGANVLGDDGKGVRVPSGLEPRAERDWGRFCSWVERRALREAPLAEYFLHVTAPASGWRIAQEAAREYALLGQARWNNFSTTAALWQLSGTADFGDSSSSTSGGGGSAFGLALAAWTNDVGSIINYASGAGGNTIVFNQALFQQPGNIPIAPFACPGGGVLAQGGYGAGGTHTFDALSFGTIVAGFIETNQGSKCFFQSNPSGQAEVFAHELGHTLGFGHSGDFSALMYALAHNDGRGAALSGDDQNAAAYLYPSGIPQPPPTAPTSLVATPLVSGTQIQLTWTDNATNESNYVGEIDLTNNGVDDFQELNPLFPAGTTVVNVGGLQPLTPYRFRVKARRTGPPIADSAYSNIASATTLASGGSPPSAPTSLVATALSSSSIQLNWTDTSGDETSFRIEQLFGFSFSEITFVGTNQNSFLVTGLAPSTAFTFRVKARNGGGDSGYTNQASATTLASGGSPPVAPSNLVAIALTPTSVQLTWTDNATNETNYLAEIDPTANGLDDFQQLSPLLGANSTGTTVLSLAASTLYRFRVKAMNASGDSLYSNVGQATTLPATGAAPSAPTNLAASALSSSSILLTWTDTSDNEDSFRVEREIAGSFVEIGGTAAGQTAFTNNGVSHSTLYSYRVRARNGNGDSAYSNTASAATLPGGGGPTSPAAPEGLAAVPLTDGHVVLTWADRSSNEESFVIEHEEAAGFQALLTLGANQQFADLPGLAAGRVHRFRVKARNSAGDSAYSNIASAALAAPAPPAGAWLETAEIPGFRFKVRVGNDRAGTQVFDCVPDTLCVAGAIAARTEVFLRVIGPRPNGKLWAQTVRFTVSRVEAWVEQSPGGTLRYYDLAALPASAKVLGGLNDSEAFSPAESEVVALDELIFRDLRDLGQLRSSAAQATALSALEEADPAPPAGAWLSTPGVPGFRFKARIGEGSSLRSGTEVDDCVPQTLCVAGSLPDRTELFVRIIGPRPNGFLWAQLVRFTVAPVELWVEQEATHRVRYYRLDKLAASSSELPGRNDSEAFVP